MKREESIIEKQKKSMMPNDLDKIFSIESCRRISINSFVHQANKTLKQALLTAQLDMLGQNVQLTTTKTRYSGYRSWFVCPNCGSTRGVLYEHPSSRLLVCRACIKLPYFKQQHKKQ